MVTPSRRPGSGLLLTLLLAVSCVAGWLLSGSFGALATGWAGLALLSLLGYLIGRHDLWLIGVVFGIGVLFGSVRWPTVLLFWILPMALGFLALIEYKSSQLASVSSYRSSLAARAWRYFGLLVGFAPTVAAVAVSVRSRDVTPAGLIIGGVAIFAMFAVQAALIFRLSRYVAVRLWRPKVLCGVIGSLLAFSPFGRWFVHALASTPAIYRAAPWLLPVVATVLSLIVARTIARANRMKPAAVVGLQLLTIASAVLVDTGMFLFYATGIAYPNARLFIGCLGVIATQAAITLWPMHGCASPLWALRRIEAAEFAVDTGLKDDLLEGWLHDAVVNRPQHPDLTLLHTVAAEATLAQMREGDAVRSRYLPVSTMAPQQIRSPKRWLDLLDWLLHRIDWEVQIKVPESCRQDFQDSLDLVLAHRDVSMANVERQHGQWAQATEHYRGAAALLDRHGRPNLAASVRLSAAELDAGGLVRLADALDTTTAIAENEGLNPVLRQRADLVAVMSLRAMHQEADAESRADRAMRTRPGRRAYRALAREDRHIGLSMGAPAERAYSRRLVAAASDRSGSTTAEGFELGAPAADHRRPRVRSPLRRLRADSKYIWLIDQLLTTEVPDLVLVMRPELLSDDALKVAERMIDNARRRGQSDRAAGLVIIRRLLKDAREHGIPAAVKAMPPMGPLPSQTLLSAKRFLSEGNDPDDALQIARWLQQAEVLGDPEVLEQMLATLDSLPADARAVQERFESRLIDFQHSGDGGTLDEVIELGRRRADDPRVRELLPDLAASATATLGTMLVQRFLRGGRPEDLTEALDRVRAAVNSAPGQHYLDNQTLPMLLIALAGILRTRAWIDADQAGLDEAIVHLERAVALLGRNAVIAHQHLGLAHKDRYQRTGDLSALEHSIREHEAGLQKARPGSPVIPQLYEGKAVSLALRYTRTRDIADLNAAVESLQAAVDHTPLHSLARASVLIELGDVLRQRGEVLGAADDLQAAGKLLGEALDVLPADGFLARMALINRAHVMRVTYLATRDAAWLDRAVADLRQVLNEQLSVDSLTYPEVHRDLAIALVMRYEAIGNPADAAKATEECREAVTTAADHVPGVLSAARFWIEWAIARSAWPEAVEAGEHAMSAAHRLLRIQLYQPDKEDWLRDLQGLPTEIALARVHTGDVRGAALAIEEGSATLLSEALQRQRVELGRLEASGHAALAARYRSAAETLAVLTRMPRLDGLPPVLPEDDREQREREVRTTAESLDSIIDEIRAVPGYEAFLKRPTFASIAAAAEHHPVIFLAAGRQEGMALVIRGGEATYVPLPSLTADAAREQGDRLRAAQHTDDLPQTVSEIAHWLWTAAAEPVLPHTDGADRITMIPVGHLSALPLHVARPASGEASVLDHMVVTYSPNAVALLESTRQAVRVTPGSLLAVAEPTPVDGPPLPSAYAEAAVATATFAPSRTLLAGPDANRAAVLAALGTARVMHFACHGYAVTDQPSLSGVSMAGDEPLTVADVAAQGLDARLVVLSACQTAVPGTILPDEVIGLPAAMLQAGTAGVVASLWPVLDNRSLILMVSFYEHWRHHGLPPADALHAAQQWMRTTSDGEKFEKFDALLGGTVWLPAETARACWDALVLTEPVGRFYAEPVGWGAFCYVGS
jgi:CHAT domain-containing protein/tetratricopeptide (TPR) repeat protein